MLEFFVFLFLIAVVAIFVLIARHQDHVKNLEQKYTTEAQAGINLAHQQYFAEAQRQLEDGKNLEKKYITEAQAGINLAHQRYFAEAQRQLEEWKEKELKTIREQAGLVLEVQVGMEKEKLALEMERWKEEYEASIRADAIARSQAVIVGRTTEHLIPYMPGLFQFNPKEARFIGAPIDMIVFDGINENDLKQIIFLEIKTGEAVLSQREKQIRTAIQEHRVVWRELRLPRLDEVPF